MPKLTIDGAEMEVAPGTTILQAAQSLRREIPYYCYHAGLSIAGNCRMCLVEVEKAPKLVIGCATPAADGMVVRTQNERVKEAQRAVMEFLLINHPLDCPICDQAGECRLQEYAVEYGSGVSRTVEPRLTSNKAIDIGEHILLDQERCIQCSRCIRFCDEVSKTGELAFFKRGEKTVIGIYPGKRLDNLYSGNTADICPVGALTVKEFRFQTRVWYLKNTPSICAGCARGCNVMVATGKQQTSMTTRGQIDDRIKRVVPRVNDAVNGFWICDPGRLSYKRLDAAPRLARAHAPAGSEVEWDDGVRRAAEALKGARRIGVLVSPRLTSETMFAWRELLESLSGVTLGVRRVEEGEDDELLIRRDKGANSQGAAWIFSNDAGEQAVVDAAGRGELDAVLVLGDPLDPEDSPRLPEAARSKVGSVIYVGAFVDAAAGSATVALPAAAWSEEDGSIVNFEGHVQRVARAHMPRTEGRPGWRVALEIAAAAGLDAPTWTEASEAFAALAATVEPFDGLTWDGLGLLGARGGARATA